MRQPGKGIGLECLEPNAAGTDVGATEIDVAVPPDRDPQPVRCFKTFTPDLREMAGWLTRCGITTVAMESTGVYWLPPYEILEEAGIRVCLVNSKHVRHVPGRKSDVRVLLLEEQKQVQRHEKHIRKQAKNLGFKLVPIPA